MVMLSQQFAALAYKQMLSASVAMMSIAASRIAAQYVDRQSKLMHDTMTSSTVAASKLCGATAKLARSAVKPVHKRVSGNVRRLGRMSK
jgi:hypothetical protein